MNESHYRDLLAVTVRGRVEVAIVLGGRADVMTTTDVFEVEPLGSWKVGLRQAIGYAAFSGLKANLAVYGGLTAEQATAMYLTLRDSPVDVRLWLYDANRGWSVIESRKDASRKWTLHSVSGVELSRRELQRRERIQARWDYRRIRRQRKNTVSGHGSGVCSRCNTSLLPGQHASGCIPNLYDFTPEMQRVLQALIAAADRREAA